MPIDRDPTAADWEMPILAMTNDPQTGDRESERTVDELRSLVENLRAEMANLECENQRLRDVGARQQTILGNVETEAATAHATDRRLAEFVQGMNEANFTVDRDWNLLFVNERWRTRFGLDPSEMVGRKLWDVFPHLESIGVGHYYREVMETREPANFEIRSPFLKRWVDVHLFPTGEGLSAYVIDIEERKLVEESLRDSQIRLEDALKTAEAASRAKDDFVAALSHELRTPLTPILTGAALLANDPRLPDDARADAEMIRRNVTLEARLIDDLLDLTRIVRGNLELKQRRVDLSDIVREAIEVCSPRIESRRHQLSIDLEPRVYWINADPVRLEQVFWNVLQNAIKFTPACGRIAIRAATSGDGRSVVCEITDSGIGIPSDQLDRIFSAFEQGKRPSEVQFGGLGLGLAIGKTLVELHGGVIEAESRGINHGALFRITLPLAGPETRGSDREDGRTAAEIQPARQLRILLVEDHADTANVLRRLLTKDGHSVRIAESIAAGFAYIELEPYDILISDLGLPDGNGTELMTEAFKRQPEIKGIAMSGFGMDEDIEASLAAGFSQHLVKPVDMDILRGLVIELFSSKR
ncbi:MAG: ATP-binding protein [Chthoniobacteraceae bacterium]